MANRKQRTDTLVTSYTTLQALGKRVKNSPHAYSENYATKLAVRASRALIEAEQSFLETPSKESAFKILKAKGVRVKDKISDYRTSDSLIRRARDTAFNDVNIYRQKIERPRFKYIATREYTHSANKKKGRYDSYSVTLPDVSGEEGLTAAQAGLDQLGANYQRVQIVLGGFLQKYFDDAGNEYQPLTRSFIPSTQSTISAAVRGYRPKQERFELVDRVILHFKTIPR